MYVMKISNCIQQIKQIRPTNNFNRSQILAPLNKDTFERTTSFKGIGECTRLLQKKYDDLTEDEKKYLRSELETFNYGAVEDTLQASKIVKKVYDTKYGENNWEYISIGRSCSTIALALSKQGVKTYSIPISGLTMGIKDGKDLAKSKGFEDYREYIYNLGLSPEKVANSGKTYIFQDYCESGISMRIFEQFIRSEEMGLDKENIVFEGINDVLLNSKDEQLKWGIDNFSPALFLQSRLGAQYSALGLKKFSPTPKLYFKDLYEIKTVKPEGIFATTKLFEFGLEDKIRTNP